MQELVTENLLTPGVVASNLLDVIKEIEIGIENSNNHVSSIENRGFFRRAFSSSNTDLVAISKSQNKINDMMLELIQEVITLNTMSFSFLAAVIGELETRAREGWIDSEGKFQQLSDTGIDFADKARSIFLKIAEGSKHTQDRIELNTVNIAEIKQFLRSKGDLDEIQNQDISKIKQVLLDKAERLASIDALLKDKDSVDSHQSQAIQKIVDELRENGRLDQERADAISQLEMDIKLLQDKLGSLENWSGTYYSRTRLGMAVLTASTFVLAIALISNLAGMI
jgi:hypothetical protein